MGVQGGFPPPGEGPFGHRSRSRRLTGTDDADRDLFADAESVEARRAVEAASAGDDSAWNDLFVAHYPQLYRFFVARLPSAEEAEDLAAETFAEAWRSRRRLRWRNRPFASWLFGIARHQLASYYRGRRPDAVLAIQSDQEPAATGTDVLFSLELRDVLGRLPTEYRTALELRYLVGLSGTEAAAAMGRSHGAYRALLHRAVRAMRMEFGDDD